MGASSTIFDFITDEDFRGSLEADYAEMKDCFSAKSWKAVHVLAGSIVEAVLIDYLLTEELVQRKDALGLNLGDAIKLARQHNVISAKASDLSSVIRDYRNLIHPGRAIRLGETVNVDTAHVAESVVKIIMAEVSRKRLENYGYTAEQIAAKIECDSSASAIVQHLLQEMKEREIERLLFTILPRRYLALMDDSLMDDSYDPARTLSSFAACFRAAVDAGNDERKTRVAKWFVSLLKKEGDRVVLSYVTAFLRANDVAHLAANEQELVKQHLLSRLKNDATGPLLTALTGIGAHLSKTEVTAFVDPLVNLACSRSDLANQARRLLQSEHRWTTDALDDLIEKRLGVWVAHHTSHNQRDKAETVKSIKVTYEHGDAPF